MVFVECIKNVILPALQTPTYNFAKFMMGNLEPLATNKSTVKDFNLSSEVVDQG